MQKKFVTNLAFLLFINLLIKPYWVLGIDREVQNVVGAESYGVYFALFNFTFLLNIVLDVGITNFNNKNIAQNNHLLAKHFSSLVGVKLMLAVIYIGLTAVVGLTIGYDYRLMKLLLILGLNQFLISFTLYLRSNIAGLHLFWIDSIVSVLDRFIMIIFCLVLLRAPSVLGIEGQIDIMHFVYAQTAAYLATSIITFFIVITKAKFFKFKFSLAFTMMIFKKSIPFAILVMLMAFYNRLDTVMLERMLDDGARQAGVYAQGFRLLDAANMIAFLFAGLLMPIFSRMLKFKESVEALVKLSFSLLITPAIIVAVSCWFYANEMMDLLYVEHIAEAAVVFPLLMACFVAISTTYIFGTLLTANGNLRELNLMAVSGISINILLNLVLIPKYQAAGSAFSSLATQFLTAMIQVLIVQSIFKFKVNYKFLLTIFTFIIGVTLINYVSKNVFSDWVLNFGVMLIASVAWAFAIRMLNVKAMFRILKYG